MPDREKVIRGLELLHDRLLDVAMQDSIVMLDVSMVANAIVLLKEQEAIPPEKGSDWWYVCGACGRGLDYHDRFCRHCGRKVKWDD